MKDAMQQAEMPGLDAWLARHRAAGPSVVAAATREAAWLLDAPLQLPAGDGRSVAELLGLVAEQLDGLTGPAAALATFLTPVRHAGGFSLVGALAEILFVPRPERTEYLQNSLRSPPWDVRRLLLEYAAWSHRVDEAATALTRNFCASRCDRLPSGCCTVLGYDLGITPTAMLEAQRLEARLAGVEPPHREDECRYHGPQGCCLYRFKSPACAGMLCTALVDDLRRRCRSTALDTFLDHLAAFRNQTLNRAPIFESMQAVVAAARPLHPQP